VKCGEETIAESPIFHLNFFSILYHSLQTNGKIDSL